MMVDFKVPVVIVGFRNPNDIIECLTSQARFPDEPRREVFIAENGGAEGFDKLVAALESSEIVGRAEVGDLRADPSVRHAAFEVRSASGETFGVQIAEMPDNLGYGGALNAWMRPLLTVQGWQGAWILNPDTAPEPGALQALVDYSVKRGKGLVGSRLVFMDDRDHLQSRGLRWGKLRGGSEAIDRRALFSVVPDADDVEARMDSPSGASMYATRALIDEIGLMDDRYFLYFEDLEWGTRAKRLNAIGYAHESIVYHQGGSTIGSSQIKAQRSPLAVYLEFRNRILFCGRQYPLWLPWTVLIQFVHAALLVRARAYRNVGFALRGILAGVTGETGRPKWFQHDGAAKRQA